MLVRSKAPLRLGLAGGGTDLPAYAEKHEGAVLNATINMYAHCTIETIKEGIIFEALDLNEQLEFKVQDRIDTNHVLKLHAGVYNKIITKFNFGIPISIKVSTYADSPIGSGLGTSSAIVVAMIKAYVELLKLPLGEYDVAKLAYEIERIDLALTGGMQDQYAATFGGFNFIEIKKDLNVIVNPLRIRKWLKDELEESIVLYFTGKSRLSGDIIDQQIAHTKENKSDNMIGMHELKESAYKMKEHLLKGYIPGIAEELNKGWEAKKKTSSSISNTMIEDVYNVAIASGALAGKVSGAGGGGFMMFIVDPRKKLKVMQALSKFGGKVSSIEFVEHGTKGWFI